MTDDRLAADESEYAAQRLRERVFGDRDGYDPGRLEDYPEIFMPQGKRTVVECAYCKMRLAENEKRRHVAICPHHPLAVLKFALQQIADRTFGANGAVEERDQIVGLAKRALATLDERTRDEQG